MTRGRFFIVSISILVIWCIPETVLAAKGDLDINEEVIYQQNESKTQSPQSSFDIDDLFLQPRNKRERQVQAQKKHNVRQAQKDVFLSKKNSGRLEEKQSVTKRLFRSDYQPLADSQTGPPVTEKKSSHVFLWGGLMIGGLLFLGAGIFLGSKFSAWKNNKTTDRS
ncbi:type VII secretion protein EssA [Ligilactobacillus pobuzihii]|uniref:type VII secretion protein EssA n=1 Tax=Ligilactobacillus pobuzihii TaxID=449659 RepID=UPI000A584669|nr:type VII secretion protein EssA [Ligilactobacillus pobuzihii]